MSIRVNPEIIQQAKEIQIDHDLLITAGQKVLMQ